MKKHLKGEVTFYGVSEDRVDQAYVHLDSARRWRELRDPRALLAPLLAAKQLFNCNADPYVGEAVAGTFRSAADRLLSPTMSSEGLELGDLTGDDPDNEVRHILAAAVPALVDSPPSQSAGSWVIFRLLSRRGSFWVQMNAPWEGPHMFGTWAVLALYVQLAKTESGRDLAAAAAGLQRVGQSRPSLDTLDDLARIEGEIASLVLSESPPHVPQSEG